MEIKIGEYKGIEVTVTSQKYTEDDLQKQLDYMLQQHPSKVMKEGPVAEGDTTLIDFKGMKDGVAFPGGTAEGYELTIGSHTFIPGFEEQMVGMALNETRNLNLKFPENYGEASLAGQDVVFEVTVHEIFTKQPAELNDEFAKELHLEGVEDVESLRKYLEDYFTQLADQKTMEKAEDEIMEALISTVECDLPQDQVDMAIQQQVSRIRAQLAQQGITLEQYLEMTGGNLEALRGQLTESAQKQVKLEAALSKIIELEGITVTEEEMEEQYQLIADNYGMEKDAVKAEISPNAMSRDLCMMKASQVVLRSAKVNRE